MEDVTAVKLEYGIKSSVSDTTDASAAIKEEPNDENITTTTDTGSNITEPWVHLDSEPPKIHVDQQPSNSEQSAPQSSTIPQDAAEVSDSVESSTAQLTTRSSNNTTSRDMYGIYHIRSA